MRKREFLFLLLILAISAFFRLWQLDSIPPGLYPDEAMNANDALESLKTKNFRVFYPENNGREGLFMWLLALSFSIFGISIWSLKIVPATIGILTVLGLYLLTKELFNKNVALISSFFLATSFWHVNFSRIGFRAIFLPFILIFGFYFLFRGFKTKKFFDFLISGIFFSLGFYTYISYRFVVILLPLVLLSWWLIYHQEKLQKLFLRNTFFLLLTILIVALPIGIYFLQNPKDFIGRATPISVFAAENPLREFGKSLLLHLGMFNFYGDPNWRHNFAGSPMLFWPIGILFLIGLIYSFFLCTKSIVLGSKVLSEIAPYWLLIGWWKIMLLPGILTFEGIPHALRTIGVIPAVYIFAGLGGCYIYQWLTRIVKNKKLLISFCLFFLLAVISAEFFKYFFKWGQKPEVKDAFSRDLVEMGNYLNSLPPEISKYVIVNLPGVPVPYPNGIPMPAQTVMFIERTKYGQPRAVYLLPRDLDKIKIEKGTIILPMKSEEILFKELSQRFPEGKIERENNFLVYKIYK